MKILHYALGFPPYRTGGLTKYCIDLILTQEEQGHNVSLLWPGRITLVRKKLSIRQGTDIKGIHNFEVVNPLPVALDEGVSNVIPFIANGDLEIYLEFLSQQKFDVIHIHTLMGLHKELIQAAKILGLRTVFTTHDYYGLCPKVTFFRNGNACNRDHDCRECVSCNANGLSLKKIMLMQSSVYRELKNSVVINFLRKRHRSKFFEETFVDKKNLPEDIVEHQSENYRKLRSFYTNILNGINVIHFNSSVSKRVYEKYITPQSAKIISITHRSIGNHKKLKKFNHKKLRITYLAPAKPYKGFNILKQALDELWNEGSRDFELNVFSLTNQTSPYMNIQNGYEYGELESIFERTDLLIAPSIWYETFGFTILEALSYGVPVLISENVGAKDLVNGIMPAINCEDLKITLYNLMGNWRDTLRKINLEIYTTVRIENCWDHSLKILELYIG